MLSENISWNPNKYLVFLVSWKSVLLFIQCAQRNVRGVSVLWKKVTIIIRRLDLTLVIWVDDQCEIKSSNYYYYFFFNTIFVSSHMYPENPEGTQVIVGSMNMGYISDTARNRTHNLFRPKREPIPLGHSDEHWVHCCSFAWMGHLWNISIPENMSYHGWRVGNIQQLTSLQGRALKI